MRMTLTVTSPVAVDDFVIAEFAQISRQIGPVILRSFPLGYADK